MLEHGALRVRVKISETRNFNANVYSRRLRLYMRNSCSYTARNKQETKKISPCISREVYIICTTTLYLLYFASPSAVAIAPARHHTHFVQRPCKRTIAMGIYLRHKVLVILEFDARSPCSNANRLASSPRNVCDNPFRPTL